MMSEKTTGGVRRLPRITGRNPEDGVELMAKCQITNFIIKKKEVAGVGSQHLANCKMMASFENGVVSISVRGGRPFMVSVRLDEMMALLKEAADYHSEKFDEGGEGNGQSGGAKEGGRE